MTPEEFFNTEEYSIDVTTHKGKHYIAYNDVKKLMVQYHEKLKQLELTSVGYSTSVEQLYHKCREQDPAITKEEFNEALETWVWRYEKDQQVKNFKIEK
jgi:hypothetical protein